MCLTTIKTSGMSCNEVIFNQVLMIMMFGLFEMTKRVCTVCDNGVVAPDYL